MHDQIQPAEWSLLCDSHVIFSHAGHSLVTAGRLRLNLLITVNALVNIFPLRVCKCIHLASTFQALTPKRSQNKRVTQNKLIFTGVNQSITPGIQVQWNNYIYKPYNMTFKKVFKSLVIKSTQLI